MKTYRAKFTGRTKNAEGVIYPIESFTKGETPDDARALLYDRWEHISGLELEECDVSLYAACVAIGVPANNHESDLYIPVTDDTRWLVKVLAQVRAETFINVEGGLWYDVPFAFMPFWEEKERAAKARQTIDA